MNGAQNSKSIPAMVRKSLIPVSMLQEHKTDPSTKAGSEK